MNIAGVHFDVRRIELELATPAYAAYSSFRKAPSPPSAAVESTIQIDVVGGPPPVTAEPVVFTNEDTWYMQREGDGYRVTLKPGAEGAAARGGADAANGQVTVVADRDTDRVTIHINTAFRPCDPATGHPYDPLEYPLDQVLLMNHLASRRGIIVHAAGLALATEDAGRPAGLVLAGVSGAGKSTISRELMAAGLGDSLLSDDRIVIRETLRRTPREETPGHPDGGWSEQPRFVAWGTPWPGDARVARNACAPLTALLFLSQASRDRLLPLEPGAALRRLLPVVSVPWYDRGRFPAVTDTCSRILATVPSFVLEFRKGPGVVELLRARRWDGTTE